MAEKAFDIRDYLNESNETDEPFDVRDYIGTGTAAGSGTAAGGSKGFDVRDYLTTTEKPFDVRDYLNTQNETQTPATAPVFSYTEAAKKQQETQRAMERPSNGYVSVADLNRAQRPAAWTPKSEAELDAPWTAYEDKRRESEEAKTYYADLQQQLEKAQFAAGYYDRLIAQKRAEGVGIDYDPLYTNVFDQRDAAKLKAAELEDKIKAYDSNDKDAVYRKEMELAQNALDKMENDAAAERASNYIKETNARGTILGSSTGEVSAEDYEGYLELLEKTQELAGGADQLNSDYLYQYSPLTYLRSTGYKVAGLPDMEGVTARQTLTPDGALELAEDAEAKAKAAEAQGDTEAAQRHRAFAQGIRDNIFLFYTRDQLELASEAYDDAIQTKEAEINALERSGRIAGDDTGGSAADTTSEQAELQKLKAERDKCYNAKAMQDAYFVMDKLAGTALEKQIDDIVEAAAGADVQDGRYTERRSPTERVERPKAEIRTLLMNAGYDETTAWNAAETLIREANAINTENRGKVIEAFAEKNGWARALLSTASFATNLTAGAGLLAPLDTMMSKSDYRTVDPNSSYFWGVNTTRQMRQAVNENNSDWGKIYVGGKEFDLHDQANDILMSSVDSVIGAMIGSEMTAALGIGGEAAAWIGGGVIGAQAAGNTMQEIAARGGTVGQVIAGGLAAGFFETFFEQFSISRLQALATQELEGGIKEILKTWVSNLPKGAFTNGMEEFFTECANVLFDRVAMGEASDWAAQIRECMAKGMTEEEAKSQVAGALWQQCVEAGVTGALQGIFMDTAGVGKAAWNSRQTTEQTGGRFNSMNLSKEDVQAFIDEGLASGKDTEAYKLAAKAQDKLARSGKLSDYELGRLYEANVSAIGAEERTAKGSGAAEGEGPKGLISTAEELEAWRDGTAEAQTEGTKGLISTAEELAAWRGEASGVQTQKMPLKLFRDRNSNDMKGTLYRLTADDNYVNENIQKGTDAVDQLIKNDGGTILGAIYREDLGSIDIAWGRPGTGKNFKGGYGISHIIEKRNAENGRGREIAYKMIDVLANAVEADVQGTDANSASERIRLYYDGYTAVLAKNKGENSWLLTGWENNNGTEASASEGGSDPVGATATAPTPTRRDGGNASVLKKSLSRSEPNRQEENSGGVRGLISTAEELSAWRAGTAEEDRARSVEETAKKPTEYRALPRTMDELREMWREDALAEADAAEAEAEATAQAEAENAAAERAGKRAEMKETKKVTGISKSAAALKKSLMERFGVPWNERYMSDHSISKVIDAYIEDVQRDGKLTRDRTEQLFDALYSRGSVFQEADSYFKEIRRSVQGAKLYVSESTRAEFGEDWPAIRRRAGSCGIQLSTENGLGIDSFTKELAEIYGGQFDDGADLRSQLEYIVDCAERGKGEWLTLKQMAEILRGEYGDEGVQAYLDGLEKEMTDAFDRFAASAGIESELRGQQADMAKKQAERRALRELQSKTLKQLQWLSKNRDRAATDLRAQFEEVLGNIDTIAINAANEMHYSKKYDKTWGEIAEMYKAAQENDQNFLPSKELQQIVDRLDKDKIADMDINALQDLYKAAVGLRTEFYNRNNIINDELGRTFADAYQASKGEIEAAAGPAKVGEKHLNTKMLTPMNNILRMAGWDQSSTFYSMAKQLETGERDYKRYKVQAEKTLEGFIKEHKEWMKTADGQGKNGVWYELEVLGLAEKLRIGEKPVFSDKTVKVYMTPAQKVFMALEAESYDNLRHMAGGRTFANKELYSKGKRSEAFSQGTTVMLAPETVKRIVSDLTPEEKALKKAMSAYYNGFSKGEINRVSNVVWGYDRAMSKSYAPIFTDQNYVGEEVGVFDETAWGVGHMKTRVDSSTPSYNISAFDAFERHVDQTARFVGYTIPVRNFQTLYNMRGTETSLKKTLSQKWGKENGTDYIKKLLTEVQSSRFSETGTVEKLSNKLLSNYITGVFGANPGIVFKQAASFPQAAAVLGFDNMPSVRQLSGKSIDVELIGKYTPELDYRMMGYSTPETAQLKNNPGFLDSNMVTKFLFRGGAITWMDGVTVKRLWPWAENYVSKNFPSLSKGSQADIDAGNSPYYKKVAEVFNDAVSLTQPMYDEMHRAGIMKESGAITRAFTMFKTVPVQQYNTLRRAFGELERARNGKGNKKEAGAKVGAAITATLGSTAMLEVIELLNQLWKNGGKAYRDDDDDELTAGSVAKEFAERAVGDLAGMVIGGSELAEIIGNLATGKKWYGIEIPGGEQLNEIFDSLIDAAKGIGTVVNDGIDLLQNGGDLEEYFRVHAGDIRGGFKEIAETASMYIWGLPAANVEKYLVGTLQKVAPGLYTAMQDAFETPGKADLKKLKGTQLETRIRDILELRITKVSDGGVQELSRLYELYGGESMMPELPRSIEVDGEDFELTATQQQKYSNAFGDAARVAINGLGTYQDYQVLEDDEKLKYVKRVYEAAREWARGESLEDYTSDELEKIHKLMEAGVSLPGAVDLMAMKAALPAAEYSGWLESRYEGQALDTVKETINFSTTGYDKFKATGMKDETIFQITDMLEALEPEEGKKSVTSYQKYRAIQSSNLLMADKNRAMQALMSETAYDGYKIAQTHKLEKEYFTALEIQSRMESDKAEDGKTVNGSKTLKVMQELDKMNLRDQQKVWLFQALGHSGENMWETAYKGDDYETYYYLSDAGKRNYVQYCSWMKVSEFEAYYEKAASFTTDPGKVKKSDPGQTRKEKVIEYIDGLDLINDKKSALYVAVGYKSTTLKDCPWYNELHFKTAFFPTD